MYILGINGGFRQGYQDISAVLLKDGQLLAAIEEERLNRIKHSAGKLPYLAIHELLKIAQISMHQIDVVAFHGSTWNGNFNEQLVSYFNNQFGYCPTIKRYHHHDCHAISAFCASNFEEALIFSYDGSGDGISFQVSIGKNNTLKTIYRAERPNSLGFFYSMMTQYCGFVKDSDEYKLMGLSSYGNRHAYDFSWLINVENGELKLNQDFLITITQGQPSAHRDEMLFNQQFLEKMGKPRRIPNAEMENFYQDVAASAQQHFEDCLLKLVQFYSTQTGIKNICLVGGSALNCVANQKIMNADFVEKLYVQPASSDSGISLGSAWLTAIDANQKPIAPKHTFLGNSYTDKEIEHVLQASKVSYTKLENPALKAAQLISENKVIGWFQGKMEFGPRALGNRSILANPTHADIQKIVNEKIKFRESFRPFCPSILEEDVAQYFIGKQKIAPYMTITYEATPFAQQHIPSVIHVDNSARIQTVNKDQNALFYALLQHLKSINGHGVVLNTSFNLSHEPIVCTPRDALATFYSSGLDALIIGNFLVEKS
ncbi:MAG: carbamoyltransferase C-terminal domain-containing protein [Chitinophagales bacterium]